MLKKVIRGRYRVLEKIHENDRNEVYKAFDESDQQMVVIKIQSNHRSDYEDRKLLKNEHVLSQVLCGTNGVRPIKDYLEDAGRCMLVMNFIEGTSLDNCENLSKFPILKSVKSFKSLAYVLAGIHEKNIVHSDLCPANIIFHEPTECFHIVDFELATPRRSGESVPFKGARTVVGSVDYIPPEQTGLLDLEVDLRSDLYSLGAVFYFMLSGQPPFQEKEVSSILHAHLAKEPRDLSTFDRKIPKMLSDVIAKLMRKDPAGRYQSSLELLADLDLVEESLECNKSDGFCLGQTRIMPYPSFSQNEVEREEIYKNIRIFFNEHVVKSSAVFLCGEPGIGKSSLSAKIKNSLFPELLLGIKKYKTPLVLRLDGKFEIDSRKNDLDDILSQLIYFLQSHLDDNSSMVSQIVQEFKKNHANHLALFGHHLMDFMEDPSEAISDKLPANDVALMYFVRDLIFVMANHVDQVIICFDDLQWADFNIISLIKELLRFESHSRINSVFSMRPPEKNSLLDLLLARLKSAIDDNVLFIDVPPFNRREIKQFVRNALGDRVMEIDQLVSFLDNRTNGNPFYIQSILHSAHKGKALRIDSSQRSWLFDIDKSNNIELGDNIVRSLCLEIEDLGESIIDILQVASILGNPFDSDIVATYFSDQEDMYLNNLRKIIASNFLVSDPDGKKVRAKRERCDERMLRFSHDQILEAVHSTISSDKKKKIAFRLVPLLEKKKDSLHSDLILLKVYMQAEPLIQGAQRRNEIANLIYNTASQLKSNGSYQLALELGEYVPKFWNRGEGDKIDSFLVDVYVLLGQVNCLLGHFERGYGHLDYAIKHVNEPSLLALVVDTKCRLLSLSKRYEDIASTGAIALNAVGLRLPQRCSTATFLYYSFRQFLILKINKKRIKSIPVSSRDLDKNLGRLLEAMTIGLYYNNSVAIAIVGYFHLLLCLKRGADVSFLQTFISQIALRIILVRFKSAESLFKVMASLKKRFDFSSDDALTVSCGLLFIVNHWFEKTSTMISDYNQIIVRLLSSGRYSELSSAFANRGMFKLASGFRIGDVRSDMKASINYRGMERTTFEIPILNTIEDITLVKDSDSPTPEREDLLVWFRGGKDRKFNEHDYFLDQCVSLLRFFLKDDLKSCLNLIPKIYLPAFHSGPVASTRLYFFLSFMCAVKDYSRLTGKIFYKFAFRVFFLISQYYFRRLSNDLSDHYSYFSNIIDAEMYRLHKKNPKTIIESYKRAISACKSQDALLYQAMTTERFGEYYMELGDRRVALSYMRDAYYLYDDYGAKVRLKILLDRYPDLEDQLRRSKLVAGSHSHKYSFVEDVVDIPSIQKAMIAISSEIHFSTILKRMMQILLEESGARDIVIVYRANGQEDYKIISRYSSKDEEQVIVTEELNKHYVPVDLIIGWNKSRNAVIYGDCQHENVSHDISFFETKKFRSFTCLPVFIQNNLRLFIVLGSDLLAHLFQSRRMRFLEITGVQLCVALDNSILYQNLENSLNAEKRARWNEAKEQEKRLNAELEKQGLVNSMKAAQEVQHASLEVGPDVSGWGLLHRYIPANHTGGDWFGRFVLEDSSRMYIAIADVAGHGLSSALVSTLIAGSVKGTIGLIQSFEPNQLEEDIRLIAKAVNHAIYQAGHEKTYSASMLILGIELSTGDSCVSYFGHPTMWRFGDNLAEAVVGSGPILGLDQRIDCQVLSFSLNHGESLFLYTDGLLENENKEGQRLKVKKVTRILRSSDNPQEVFETFDALVSCFDRSSHELDDSTFLIVSRLKEVDVQSKAG